MKKIILVALILCIFSSCSIFRTRDVTINNNSDHKAYISVTEFRRNGDLHGSTGGSDYVELLPHTSTAYKLYDKGEVKLTKPNRNFLKKQSNVSYEVLNSPKKIVKVFNKTGENIVLNEANNLFDTIKIPKIEENMEVKHIEIEVFTIDNFFPYAVTDNEDKIMLKVSFQTHLPDMLLIITF